MQIINKKINELKPYENNPRMNDDAVEAVANSIKEFGFKVPIIIDKDDVIIAGHTRLKAVERLGLEEVPCVVASDLTEEQAKAFRLADNKVGELAEWDMELLEEELDNLSLLDFDMEPFGFENQNDDLAQIVEDEVPEIDEESEPITKLGDIWQLGKHRLVCGDSTSIDDIKKLMNGEKADLVFTDPPYGMKKEKDGVINDNLNYDDLLEFNKKWIPLTFEALKENGSWYCWGIDEPLMDIYSNILKPMQKQNKITLRNLITWKKENDNPTMLFNGACSSNNRSYYANEKCLFVMCGVQGFNNNADHYDETFEPIRAYMEQEAKKVGLTSKKLTEITGVQMYGHWFTKSQFTIIPEEHYTKLQNHYKNIAFQKPYNELQKLFDKEAVMAKRAFFDGKATQCIDVWCSDVTSQKERELTGGHATPKPIALCSRAIRTSSRVNEIVLDTFGGSGSTLIACEQTNRRCAIMELSPNYCDVIIKRWEALTGEKATRIDEQ